MSGKLEIRSTLGVNAVVVNPEPKRHVGIEQQVSNSPTANVGVLISVPIGELNKHNAKDRRDLQHSYSVRGTRSNRDEHVVNECKVNNELRP